MIELTSFLLNDVVGSDGPFGLNEIASQLTSGTGEWDIPPHWLPNDVILLQSDEEKVKVVARVEAVSLYGLNSWSRLDLLEEAEGDYELVSRIGIDRFRTTIRTILEVTASDGPPKRNSMDVSLGMGRYTLPLTNNVKFISTLTATLMALINETLVTEFVNDSNQVR